MAYLPIRTPADLTSRLVPGLTREDSYLEFKGEIYGRNNDGRRECARDVAQFANASGGSLVIGATEREHTLEAFVDVPAPDDVIHWIDDVLKGQLEPVPAVEPHVITHGRRVRAVVVNVPPSAVLVARKSGEGYEFPVRAADSRRFLTLSEMEARMQGRERMNRLRIEQIGADEAVGLDAMVDRGLGHDDWRVGGVDDHVLRLRKGELEVPVPLAYVETVYRAGLPAAAWIIALSCFVTRHMRQPLILVTKERPFGRNEGHYRSRGLVGEG